MAEAKTNFSQPPTETCVSMLSNHQSKSTLYASAKKRLSISKEAITTHNKKGEWHNCSLASQKLVESKNRPVTSKHFQNTDPYAAKDQQSCTNTSSSGNSDPWFSLMFGRKVEHTNSQCLKSTSKLLAGSQQLDSKSFFLSSNKVNILSSNMVHIQRVSKLFPLLFLPLNINNLQLLT